MPTTRGKSVGATGVSDALDDVIAQSEQPATQLGRPRLRRPRSRPRLAPHRRGAGRPGAPHRPGDRGEEGVRHPREAHTPADRTGGQVQGVPKRQVGNTIAINSTYTW